MIATKLGTMLLLGFMAADLATGIIRQIPPDAGHVGSRDAVVQTYGVINR